MKKESFLVFASVLICLSCSSGATVKIDGEKERFYWNPGNPAYRHFYGWDDRDGQWNISWIEGPQNQDLAVHVFSKGSGHEYDGTVFLLHGYLEHIGLRVPIAQYALRKNYLVVGLDFPGHGLSSGTRSDIEDFYDYGRSLQAVLESADWPKPWRAIGHSTGAAAIMMVMQSQGNPFEFTIFESPLVRTWLWEPSMTAVKIFKNMTDTLPRRLGGLPKSQSLYDLLIQDPLYPDVMAMGWAVSLRDYVESIQDWKKMDGRVLVLQGDDDTVVDAAYNVPYLKEHFKDIEIIMIGGGKHILLRYEGPPGDMAWSMIDARW